MNMNDNSLDIFGEKFERIKKIGKGVFGNVYRALDKENKQIVAIKKYRYRGNMKEMKENAQQEIYFLQQLCSHPNIVHLNGVLENESVIVISLEVMDMNLTEFLKRSSQQLDDNLVQLLSHQLLSGIGFCHARDIIHLDLKPQNILINKFKQLKQLEQLKICDFGSAKRINHIVSTRNYNSVGTLWYRDPEILLGQKKYYTHHDIWSAGCIISEIVTKHILFCGESQKEQIDLIFQLLGTPYDANTNVNEFNKENIQFIINSSINSSIGKPTTNLYWPNLSSLPNYKPIFPKWGKKNLSNYFFKKYNVTTNDNIIDLMEKCLLYDSNRRLTAMAALQHQYFNNINNINNCE